MSGRRVGRAGQRLQRPQHGVHRQRGLLLRLRDERARARRSYATGLKLAR